MSDKLKQLNNKGFTCTNSRRGLGGFTIIEVLIVLAIAGLIMLIVFLAVPALQRNSRNNSRKNDVLRALSAAQEIHNNNNWNTISGNDLHDAIGIPNYYEISQIKTWQINQANIVGVNASSLDSIIVYQSSKCSTAAGEEGMIVPATKYQVAVGWSSEPSKYRCLDG